VVESELRTALELEPRLLAARAVLANVELRKGDRQQALDELNQVVAAKPNSLNPYVLRSMLFAERGDYSQAEKDLLPLLDQFPQAPSQAATYRALALVSLRQSRYTEARNFLSHASQLQPNAPENYYLLGLSYLAEHKPEAALSPVDAQLKKQPKWLEGYVVAGQLLAQAGRFTQAEDAMHKALAINSKLPKLWLQLGEILMAESKYDQAQQAYITFTKQAPQNAAGYLRLGQVCDQRSEWVQAQTNYQKVLSLQPDNVVAKNNLAWDYAEHGGNIDLALRLAQEAKEANPDDASISDTLGWIYVKTNTLGNAIQLLEESVKRAPKNPNFTYHLGVAYLHAGRMEQAKQLLQTTLELGPGSAQAGDARKLLASIRN